MKILEIAAAEPHGDLAELDPFVAGLSHSLGRLGHEAHLLLVGAEDSGLQVPDVKFHSAPTSYPFIAYNEYLQSVLESIPLSQSVAELWNRHGPFQAILAHDWKAGLAASLAQRVFGAPLVAFFSGCQVGRIEGKGTREELYVAEMERWMSGRADRVIVPSVACRRELEASYLVPIEKVSAIPGGVDPEPFAADVDHDDFRQMFASEEESLVLFCGPLKSERGADLFVEAIPQVLRGNPETRFVVAGEGPLSESLEGRVRALGVEGSVRFTGHVGQTVRGALYQVSDLLALPSRYEPSAGPILEAVMHGLPVVAAGVGATTEVRAELRSTTLSVVQAADQAAVAKGILASLARYPRHERSKPTLDRIPLRYRWESCAHAISAVLEGVCGSVAAR